MFGDCCGEVKVCLRIFLIFFKIVRGDLILSIECDGVRFVIGYGVD